MNPNVLWITAALLPFVALLAVTEGTRSAVYGMEGAGAGHPVFSEKCPAGPALPGGGACTPSCCSA